MRNGAKRWGIAPTPATLFAGCYGGPGCPEVIGPKDYELACQAILAADSYSHMIACLTELGAR